MTARVFHTERASGVDPRLRAFLGWWQMHGLFDVTVLPDGGLRTDAAKQARYYRSGTSNAPSLAETPHGRGAALDLAPLIAGVVPWGDTDRFKVMGMAAEVFGLVWGGRWSHFVDMPHVEVSNWESLPFPPQALP